MCVRRSRYEGPTGKPRNPPNPDSMGRRCVGERIWAVVSSNVEGQVAMAVTSISSSSVDEPAGRRQLTG